MEVEKGSVETIGGIDCRMIVQATKPQHACDFTFWLYALSSNFVYD